ncbi:hypothetical protein [Riemerella anatipestifer]|uniref:Uncharacterized protein n=1 Tax=Riemerella anatipestifer TaxID=34085 RepID=A0A1S7DPD1_RIEAN|nr:hypothetical protein [Riemerella anatipestifer]AQY20977.1 hypothetical protein AB406_0011 [Riemerella anatipestifer]MCO4304973.1 hypothetical protein [Riemerella anatipestifer]MCO7353850.1 hypothetical protein [Riemerella anatipestifer]MCQ4040354.1 hypothetical protein [Riemerella anatipestifer]MCT6761968.1 hypothetical protein [Riemerella anatipestifer]
MNKRKIKFLAIIGLVFCFVVRFFCGVYEHDEFAENYYFIKHKPTWKWRFYSPRGMSDLELNQMTNEQKYEQKMFDEYVENRIKR